MKKEDLETINGNDTNEGIEEISTSSCRRRTNAVVRGTTYSALAGLCGAIFGAGMGAANGAVGGALLESFPDDDSPEVNVGALTARSALGNTLVFGTALFTVTSINLLSSGSFFQPKSECGRQFRNQMAGWLYLGFMFCGGMVGDLIIDSGLNLDPGKDPQIAGSAALLGAVLTSIPLALAFCCCVLLAVALLKRENEQQEETQVLQFRPPAL